MFLNPAQLTAAAQNAGILPYAYKDGKAYFLLGLENRTWDRNRPWAKKARSTWVWTDFGGKCDTGDYNEAAQFNTNQETYCAARECTEETRYVFGNKLPLNPLVNKQSQEFKLSLRYWINHVTNKFYIDSFYVQVFAQVDYIYANKLKNAPKVPSYEKDEYRWISVKDVLQALKKPDNNGFFRFAFQHHRTNKLFSYFANTLRREDVQQFIKNTILAQETVPPIPVTPPIPVGPELRTLSTDLQKLQRQLNNLMQQLQALP